MKKLVFLLLSLMLCLTVEAQYFNYVGQKFTFKLSDSTNRNSLVQTDKLRANTSIFVGPYNQQPQEAFHVVSNFRVDGKISLNGSFGTAGQMLKSNGSGSNPTWVTPSFTDITGVVPIAKGGTNSSTALNNNRVIISSGGKIVELGVLTGLKAMITDANGLPQVSTTSNTQLAYLDIASGRTGTGSLVYSTSPTFTTGINLSSLTSGGILVANGTAISQDPTKFFWDFTNDRLGIGNVTPATTLDVTGTLKVSGASQFSNYGTGIWHSDASGNVSSSLIVNADVSNSASIAASKLADGGSGNVLLGGSPNTWGSITNSHISSSANIALSKIAVTNTQLVFGASGVGATDADLTFNTGTNTLSSTNIITSSIQATNTSYFDADVYTGGANHFTGQLSGGNNTRVRIGNNGSGSNENLYFQHQYYTTVGGWQDGNTIMHLYNQNVAIGSLTPTSKLHVGGTFRANNSIIFDNYDGYLRGNGTSDITAVTTIPATDGGTGITSYTTGDIIYASATNTLAKRAIGSNNTVLRVSGGLPVYGQVVLSTDVTGTLPAANVGLTNSYIGYGSSGGLLNGTPNLAFSNSTNALSVGNIKIWRNGAQNSGNLAIGTGAINATVTGLRNVALGDSALRVLTGGYDNVAVGVLALQGNSLGSLNTGIGSNALVGGNSDGNTAVGAYALSQGITGSNNIAIGNDAGKLGPTNGNYNIYLGHTGLGLSGDNNIIIGNNAQIMYSGSNFRLPAYTSNGIVTTGSGNGTFGVTTPTLGAFLVGGNSGSVVSSAYANYDNSSGTISMSSGSLELDNGHLSLLNGNFYLNNGTFYSTGDIDIQGSFINQNFTGSGTRFATFNNSGVLGVTSTIAQSYITNLSDSLLKKINRTGDVMSGTLRFTNAPTRQIEMYNSSSYTSNTERASMWWNGNKFLLETQISGSGTLRPLALKSSTREFTVSPDVSPTGFFNFYTTTGTADLSVIVSNPAYTTSSGRTRNLSLYSTITQSGTAAHSELVVSPYIQTKGSGSLLLIDAGTSLNPNGSGHITRFSVDTLGRVISAGGTMTASLTGTYANFTDSVNTTKSKASFLSINSSASNYGIINTTGAFGGRLDFKYAGVTYGHIANGNFIYASGVNTDMIFGSTTGRTILGTNSLMRLIVTNAGLVGIKNPSPTYDLDVSGTVRSTTDAYFATSSGSVGVGTTLPASKLHVSGTGTQSVRVQSTDSNPAIFYTNGSYGQFSSLNGSAYFTTTTASPLYFQTNSVTRGYFDGTIGNLGIGATSGATHKVSAFTSDTTTYSPTTNAGDGIMIFNNNTANNNLKYAQLKFQVSANGAQNALGFLSLVQEAPASNNSYFTFKLRNTAGSYSEVARMVGQTGNVGIGTIAPNSRLDVAGDITLSGGNTNNIVLKASSDVSSTFRWDVSGLSSASATFQVGRNTNATGGLSFTVFKGDNTNSPQTQFNGNGHSFLNMLGGSVMIGSSSAPSEKLSVTGNIYSTGKRVFDATMTAGGTTGNQTINKPSGSVNFAAAATSITVTNSYVTSNSIITAVVMTNDATAYVKNIIPSNGSFVINLGSAATAETKVGFIIAN